MRRQISRINGKVVEAPLKTKNAYRVIPLGEQALAVLQSQQEKTHSEYVFPSPNGGPISPDSVRNMLRRVLKRAGLPYVRFHDLRHTFATLQIAAGVDIRTLQARTGHAQASTLVNIYSHALKSAQEAASDALESVLLPAKEG